MSEIVRQSDLAELTGIAKLLAASGYFDAKGTAEQAVAQLATKILAGREMGLGPFAAVQGIHVIQGRPALSANLIASAIKSSPKYDYRVRRLDPDTCKLEFFERVGGRLEPLGVSTFTAADARAAGTQNMVKFARNMLFARAISNGARWYCPDLFAGSAVYVPEELGAQVDDEGNVIDQPQRPQLAAPAPVDEPVDLPAEVAFWTTPQDAYDWAVGIEASENVDAARAAFKRIVDAQFDGRLTPKNQSAAMAAFHADRMAKLSAASIDLAAEPEVAH
jgi:hypothetical protein